VERRVEEMLEIAGRILGEGRKATEEERSRFKELSGEVEAQPAEWRNRFADLTDRLAAALEGIGL
jgi:hypothetical protein